MGVKEDFESLQITNLMKWERVDFKDIHGHALISVEKCSLDYDEFPKDKIPVDDDTVLWMSEEFLWVTLKMLKREKFISLEFSQKKFHGGEKNLKFKLIFWDKFQFNMLMVI